MYGLCHRHSLGHNISQYISMHAHPQSLGRYGQCSWVLHQRQCSLFRERRLGHLSGRTYIRATYEDVISTTSPTATENCSYASLRRWWFCRYHGHDKTQFLESSTEHARSIL